MRNLQNPDIFAFGRIIKQANIKEEIKKLALDKQYFTDIKEQKSESAQPDIIKKEISKLENQLSKLMDLYSLGNMPIDVLQTKIKDINDKKVNLENELESLLSIDAKLSHSDTIKIARSFSDILERGDFDEIRTVIDTLIDRIIIDNDDIIIHWNFV